MAAKHAVEVQTYAVSHLRSSFVPASLFSIREKKEMRSKIEEMMRMKRKKKQCFSASSLR